MLYGNHKNTNSVSTKDNINIYIIHSISKMKAKTKFTLYNLGTNIHIYIQATL
jgi:hypothetical protein